MMSDYSAQKESPRQHHCQGLCNVSCLFFQQLIQIRFKCGIDCLLLQDLIQVILQSCRYGRSAPENITT